jgi:hypothetical protein
LQKSEEPTDLDKELDGAITMGKILKVRFGESLYSLAFSSYEGDFGMLGFPLTSLTTIAPPKGSIEEELSQRKNNLAFVNFSNVSKDVYFYSSALGNLPIYAPWSSIFDGLIFIKHCEPPKLNGFVLSNTDTKTTKPLQNTFKQNEKSALRKIINAETKSGISYANVYVLNTAKGVATNDNGEFVFHYTNPKRTDKIIVSAIGYKTDTLTYKDFLVRKTISLQPSLTQLDEVIIRSKPLKAKDIIKLAEKKIADNYYQKENEQEFFYRIKQYKEDSVTFNEEAAVVVYNPIGYQSSNNATRKLKGNILQYRNTTNNNENKNLWQGIGSLWLVYTHDLILDKDNVLHRSPYYDLELMGTTQFEGKKVYEIGFTCKRPGAYTTGFGYPSPISATGKIYIDVESYAVLKFEILIQRKPFKNKRQPYVVLDAYGHHIVQTYKQLDGKYFLNYTKQSYYSKWTNTKKNKTNNFIEIRELLSTQINPKPNQIPTLSLMNIKSKTPNEDVTFWQNHNFKVEDNIKESYLKFKF